MKSKRNIFGIACIAHIACAPREVQLADASSKPPIVEQDPGLDAPRHPKLAKKGQSKEADFATLPLHQQVIQYLQKDRSVIPDRPSVHPLHTVYNREATVPPMCYTRTEGQHNPCYVCHQDATKGRLNTMDDGHLQESYSFSDLGTTNHWKNLFEDRRQQIASMSDEAILAWVDQDNYSKLAARLIRVNFAGYIPDLDGLQNGAAAFDDEGFAKDGSHWVAFNYKPMPSTFWPTNGATDDVMIRLPVPFRTTTAGVYSRDVYRANLALVEANIKGFTSISVKGIDERVFQTDLNGDGKLGIIDRIHVTNDYVGAAKGYFRVEQLYPLDTEFLHSVRYLGVDAAGNISIPKRMKELRYMRRRFSITKDQLAEVYREESYAKDDGQLPGYVDRGAYGLDNGMGWVISGFIENREGELRVANFEETLFCMGCHTSIGSTIDNVFSFARKVDGADGWGYINLRGMPDAPNMGESKGEIATYLARAGGGGEFRSNPEMVARWFDDGRLAITKVEATADVYELITPSRERAIQLNKAYRAIVEQQDYVYGRDPTLTPPEHVYETVNQTNQEEAPTLPAERTYTWDIRLDWTQGFSFRTFRTKKSSHLFRKGR